MPAFQGARKTLSEIQNLNGSKEQVFPLLCPVREYDWIEDWSCELIFSESGIAEPHCVFSTGESTTRLEEGGEEIWIISRHEPPNRIDFVKFAAGLYVVKYEITLETAPSGGVTATWTQHFTGLSEAGNQVIAARSQDDYASTIKVLEANLNHYLSHGECLRE